MERKQGLFAAIQDEVTRLRIVCAVDDTARPCTRESAAAAFFDRARAREVFYVCPHSVVTVAKLKHSHKIN